MTFEYFTIHDIENELLKLILFKFWNEHFFTNHPANLLVKKYCSRLFDNQE